MKLLFWNSSKNVDHFFILLSFCDGFHSPESETWVMQILRPWNGNKKILPLASSSFSFASFILSPFAVVLHKSLSSYDRVCQIVINDEIENCWLIVSPFGRFNRKQLTRETNLKKTSWDVGGIVASVTRQLNDFLIFQQWKFSQ